jgi:hypothetical protein
MGQQEEHSYIGWKVSETSKRIFPRAIDADKLCRDQAYLESLVPEVVENVQGRRIMTEGEDDELETEETKAQ